MKRYKSDDSKSLKENYIQAYARLNCRQKKVLNAMSKNRCSLTEAIALSGEPKKYIASCSKSPSFVDALSSLRLYLGGVSAESLARSEAVASAPMWEERDAKSFILEQLKSPDVAHPSKVQYLRLYAQICGWVSGGRGDAGDDSSALMREIRRRLPIGHAVGDPSESEEGGQQEEAEVSAK